MALIPSESLNFPDSFRANVGWRVTDQAEKLDPGPVRERPPAGTPRPKPGEPAKAAPEEHPQAPSKAPEPASATAPMASPTVQEEPETDERQLELIPKGRTEEEPPGSQPGTAEMNALFRHFLAAGAASNVSAQPPNGESVGPAVNGAKTAAISPTIAREPSPEPAVMPNDKPSVTTGSKTAVVAGVGDPGPAEAENKVLSPQAIVAALQSLPREEPEPPSGSVIVETPAQAHHIMELIAAAVQRGALVGETVPEPSRPEPMTPEPPPNVSAPKTVSESSVARVPLPEPPPATAPAAPESAPASIEAPPAPEPRSPSALPNVAGPPSPHSDVPKTPAKIRITPRKIKPRPQVQQTSDAPVAEPAVGYDLSADIAREARVRPIRERRAEPSAAAEKPSAAPLPERVEPSVPRPELSARKIAAARMELAQSDLFQFSVRERRNRWIGFGLSELAAITALILLGRFGFTHHFPDPTLKVLVFILIFAAAAVAIALPIAFFRNDPKRWDRAGR